MVSVVKNGFRLSIHDSFHFHEFEQNRPSTSRNIQFVSQEIHELLKAGSITPAAQTDLMCISPLLVAEGKKPRLILDLSYLNKFMPKTFFRLEDLSKVIHLLPPGGFMTKFDFRKGYHHISIHSESQNYLGFYWDHERTRSFFKFTVLPFGLSVAPWLFTKIFRPLVKKWRKQGISMVLYLDDGLVFADSREKCELFTKTVLSDLHSAGVQIALEKSILNPVQKLEFLGCDIDLLASAISISGDRIEKAKTRLDILSKSKCPSIHDRMRFLGSIISMNIVVPDAVLQTRATSTAIAEAQSVFAALTTRVKPSQGEIHEWNYWVEKLRAPEGRALPRGELDKGELWFFSDASSSGVGAIFVRPKTPIYLFGAF